MPKLRTLCAYAIAWLPLNAFRVRAYRALGYRLGDECRIGLGTVISVDHFECAKGVSIRRGNSIIGPITVKFGAGTFVGRWNRIECGDAAASPNKQSMNYARCFETGEDCLINENHLFDVLGRIRIGNGSWIAGFGSQFITHGASTMNRDIDIGERSFIGSAVRFAPGSGVGSRVIVAMGSVVTRPLAEDDAVVGGIPARILKHRQENDAYRFERTW